MFVYRTPGNDIETALRPGGHSVLTSTFMYFLGIHWGQFPEEWEITEKDKHKEATIRLIRRGKYIKGLSGMTCVMPPEPILEALNMRSFKIERSRGDIALEKKFEKHGYPPNEE